MIVCDRYRCLFSGVNRLPEFVASWRIEEILLTAFVVLDHPVEFAGHVPDVFDRHVEGLWSLRKLLRRREVGKLELWVL